MLVVDIGSGIDDCCEACVDCLINWPKAFRLLPLESNSLDSELEFAFDFVAEDSFVWEEFFGAVSGLNVGGGKRVFDL